MIKNLTRLLIILACETACTVTRTNASDADVVGRVREDARLQNAGLVPVAPVVARPTEGTSPAKLVETLRDGTAADADAMDLGNAARITLNFRGYPDLSRDYRIAADGTVSVPVIGRLKVSSMTPSALETTLATKMGTVIGSEAYVTVEIAEYRPVFVTGYVTKSESSSWQPGMTVLQALAMSGGIYRPTGAAAGANSMPAELERTRIKAAAIDLKSSLANLARLKAEQNGSATIDMPSELVSLVGEADARALIASQTLLLATHASAYKDQLAAINRGNELGRKELDGLNAQSVTVKKLLEARRTYRSKIEDLQARGIVVASRSMEEDIKVSDLEEKGVNIAVATARILATIAGAERDAVKLRLETRAAIEASIANTEHDVARFTIEIDAAKSAYTKLTGELAPSTNHKEVAIGFTIVRKENAALRTIVVDQTAILRPGDVLIVTARE